MEKLVLFKKNIKFVENVKRNEKKYWKNGEIDDESEKNEIIRCLEGSWFRTESGRVAKLAYTLLAKWKVRFHE